MSKHAKQRWITGAVASGLLALSLWLPAGQAKEPSRAAQTLRKVRTDVVAPSEDRGRFRVHGLVRAQERAALSFTVPGRVRARPVRVGDRVARGALLASIDAQAFDHGARAADATARQVSAQLAQHELDRSRLAQLEAESAVSREQLERMASAVDAARAGQEAAEVQAREARRFLRETELRAPFAGTIVAVLIEPGEFASPGRPVLVLSGADGLEVEVDVPGRVAENLRLGDAAQLTFPLDAERGTQGNITSIGESAAGPGRMFPVAITLASVPARSVRAGSAATVELLPHAERELTVPVSAIVAPSGVDPAVLCVRAGRVVRVPVALSNLHETRIGVRGALAEGERVVVAGYTGLVAGELVEDVR